ncbi:MULTISPECIES: helicase associated domain-containing protein [unclassified Streptomyces]|uniref:helicase associated domain-containing protein n=1 Tax=unclassified Streptomyces TaxID=2593676 RepID=UPI002F916BB2
MAGGGADVADGLADHRVHSGRVKGLKAAVNERGEAVGGSKGLENTFGITPAEEDERPVKQTQDTKWQFHAREGHLRVPRKHVEHMETEDGPTGRQDGVDGGVVVKLGMWLDNVRKHAAKLPEQRRTDLDQFGMRW